MIFAESDMARNGSKPTFVVPRVRVRSTAPIENKHWNVRGTILDIHSNYKQNIFVRQKDHIFYVFYTRNKHYWWTQKAIKNSKNNNVICGAINEWKPSKQKTPTWRQLEILAFYNHMKDTKRKNECKKIVESFQREFSDLSSLSARKWRDE